MAPREFYVGDPAIWFACPASNNKTFHFETAAGRYLVLSFLGAATKPESAALMEAVTGDLRPYFDDNKIAFFGVTNDPEDESSGRLQGMMPGIRHFWDYNRELSGKYGAIGDDGSHRGFTLVFDPFLRVVANFKHVPDNSHVERIRMRIKNLPSVDHHAGVPLLAPVLVLPRVFEPQFCRDLINLYEKHGGTESGFMRERDGKTIPVLDSGFKRRKDFVFDEEEEYKGLRSQIRMRFERRLLPEIKKAFQYDVERIERYIVACYEGETQGFFRAHRDNTTKGTAHRRFACTLNLNADEYEGGDLRFPEFGSRTYRAPTGGAVVFSCSLLHEATPVTKGKRYAFLPFFYDAHAEKVREANKHLISEDMLDLNAAKAT